MKLEAAWKYGFAFGVGLSGAACLLVAMLVSWLSDQPVHADLLCMGAALWFMGSGVGLINFMETLRGE